MSAERATGAAGGAVPGERLPPQRTPRRPRRGFTLIELMVTISLVALLAAVAYPSYVSSVQKARRGEAKAALTEAAQRLERYYTENNSYRGALFCVDGSAGCTAATKIYNVRSENGHYDLGFRTGPTVSGYVLEATPLDNQAQDSCGRFTLDQAGRRGAFELGGTEIDARKCW